MKFREKTEENLTVEVSQHLGDDTVRCIAMGTDRRTSAWHGCSCNRSDQFQCPVGEETLGRMFNVLGEPIDESRSTERCKSMMPIHRKAPAFEEQATSTEMLETGIKVVDLLCPYQKGGKIRSVWWCRCR